MHALSKYLKQWAAPETRLLTDLPGHWQQALVIPAYREGSQFLENLYPALVQDSTLVILVLNRPNTDPETSWAEALIQTLTAPHWRQEHLSLHSLTEKADLLLVDRVIHGPAIPDKEGVGTARKTGADLACQLIDSGQVHSPWIYNTDADAILPGDYFTACANVKPGTAACLFPFEHVFTDPDLPRWPTLLYECHLHHYVNGLRQAGSPYAWHTVGSTLAVHYTFYAAARGFPRRSGGEDFYLLNKLAKLGGIHSLSDPVIALQARHSHRVPFGTGPATQKLSQLQNLSEARSYHPQGFHYLEKILKLLESAAQQPDIDIAKQAKDIADEHNLPLLPSFIIRSDLADLLANLRRQNHSALWRQRQLMEWFDGFRTLKCLHWLRDQGLQDIPLYTLLDLPFCNLDDVRANRHFESQLDRHNRLQRHRLADDQALGIHHL